MGYKVRVTTGARILVLDRFRRLVDPGVQEQCSLKTSQSYCRSKLMSPREARGGGNYKTNYRKSLFCSGIRFPAAPKRALNQSKSHCYATGKAHYVRSGRSEGLKNCFVRAALISREAGSSECFHICDFRFHLLKIPSCLPPGRPPPRPPTPPPSDLAGRRCPRQRPTEALDHPSHRIQPVEWPPFHGDRPDWICDRRGEHPELLEKRNGVTHVAINRVESREPQTDAVWDELAAVVWLEHYQWDRRSVTWMFPSIAGDLLRYVRLEGRQSTWTRRAKGP